MKKIFTGFIVCLLALSINLILLPQKAQAATLDVCPTCAYTTITNAVAAASNGDTINVAAGTYLIVNAITVAGFNGLTFTGAGRDTTIINGQDGDITIFNISNSQNIAISGFTLTQASEGIVIINSSGTINANNFEDISSLDESFGIFADTCQLAIYDNIFTDIDGDEDGPSGAIFADSDTDDNIYGNNINHNQNGIIAENGEANIHNNNVSSNTGLGIAVLGMSNVSISQNITTANQGGVLEGLGSAITSLESKVDIFANQVYNNSGLVGGGITLWGSSLGSKTYNNYIANNDVSWVGGGLISIDDPSSIFNNTIVNNQAEGREPTGENFIKSIQPSLADKYPALVESNDSLNQFLADFKNKLDEIKTQYINPGEPTGGGIFIHNSDLNPSFFNNIVFGNNDDLYFDTGSTAAFTFSDIEEGYAGEGNINSDPRLTGFVLGDDSPCINTGTSNNAPGTDINGTARPQSGSIDIGAYEHLAVLPQAGILSQSSSKPDTAILLIIAAPLVAIYFFWRKIRLKNKF